VKIELWFLWQFSPMMMGITMWNASLTLISWNQFQNKKPLEHIFASVIYILYMSINFKYITILVWVAHIM
jgi:hypothetical protein